MKLTDIQINNTKTGTKTIKLTDGGGLYLECRPNGGQKHWRYRYKIGGKENVFAIASYPEKSKEWSAGYTEQFETFMEADVYPYIGNLPIRIITPQHLLTIIQRVEKRGAPTVAILIRQWLSPIFSFAIITLRANFDPAYPLRGAVRRPPIKHNQPLTPDQIKQLLGALAEYEEIGLPTTVIALRLMLYTFVRTAELVGAKWDEIRWDEGLWRIPAERMKMKKPHIVPLATQIA